MRDFAIAVATAANVLGLCGVAFAEGPPDLDVGPSCDAAIRGGLVGRDKEACQGDERGAKDALAKDWDSFDRAARTQCVGMNSTGGPSSYVELLSCIEVMRDAKIMEQNDPLMRGGQAATPSTTGSASGSRRGGMRERVDTNR
jgi:hypothetical protein